MKKTIAGTLIIAVLLSSCANASESTSKEENANHPTDEIIYEEPEASADYEEYSGTEMTAAGEEYLSIRENNEVDTELEDTVTISLKVDTAAYTNTVRYIESGSVPPADAVRTEEFINYFPYEEETEPTDSPFSISAEVGDSPFSPGKKTAFIRIKTDDIDTSQLPPSNLTFLIDTSGSMDSYDKLPLLKQAFSLLTDTLTEDDMVSIITYAGSSEIVLDSVSGADKDKILNAINNLSASGSTAGADGIDTAYKLAEKNFRPQGNNRVILATDGDFNVGYSDTASLEDFVSSKSANGVYLSILGFGTGNIRDDIMETLSAHGNGNYGYINSRETAEKLLVDELGSSLFTVADDVKAQVVFNPALVKNYRLIGYENRKLSNDDFSNDEKDAGEIGAGSDVAAMFEFELSDTAENRSIDEQLMEIRIRYKNPGEDESRLVTKSTSLGDRPLGNSTDFNFACCVAAFSEILRQSQYSDDIRIEDCINLASDSLGTDVKGYRSGFVKLIQEYQDIY